jgi:hypothetical protein
MMQMPKNEANMRLEVCQSYFSVWERRSLSHSFRIVFFLCVNTLFKKVATLEIH